MGLKIEYVDLEELKPNEYNPKKLTEKEAEDLKESVKRFGIVDPLVVNSAENRKNVIIGGHQRYKIYKELGIDKVPVVYVNIPDIQKEQELCLRLSKNTGEWDYDLLANFSEEMLKEVGFEDVEIEKNLMQTDFWDDLKEWEYDDGTIRVFFRVGEVKEEIDVKTYEKLKELVEKHGGVKEFVEWVVNIE